MYYLKIKYLEKKKRNKIYVSRKGVDTNDRHLLAWGRNYEGEVIARRINHRESNGSIKISSYK